MDYIYIVGAGRSGTTVTALFLQYLHGATYLGELNHLGDFLLGRQRCICEKNREGCEVRDQVVRNSLDDGCIPQYVEEAKAIEAHRSFLLHFRKGFVEKFPLYVRVNNYLGSGFSKGNVVIDSGKYVSRGLALNNIFDQRVKFLWVTRDPRGVVQSFGKNVQTRRNTLSACFYYTAVNLAVLIASFTLLKGRIKRMKYEDLLLDPDLSLSHLADFFGRKPLAIRRDDSGDVVLVKPKHMLGGNRLIKSADIVLSGGETWKTELSTFKRIFIWLACLPTSVLLGYHP